MKTISHCITYLPCSPLEDGLGVVGAGWKDTEGLVHWHCAVVHRGKFPTDALLDVPWGVCESIAVVLETWEVAHQRPETA